MDEMPTQLKTYVIDPALLLLALFVGCSFIGWATLIWSGQRITRIRIIAGMSISGAVGIMFALALWENLAGRNLGLLVAVSLLAGAGGTATLDVCLAWLHKVIRDRAGLPAPQSKDEARLAAAQPTNNDERDSD